MIEPKRIIIKDRDDNDMVFNLQPLPALKAIVLDKKIMSLLIPALGGIKDLDKEFDLKIASMAMAESLTKLSDQEYEKFVIDLLTGVQLVQQGQEIKSITTDQINVLFLGNAKGLYKLMFEVMKFNKFTPFELVEGGNLIQKITGSMNKSPKTKKNLKG